MHHTIPRHFARFPLWEAIVLSAGMAWICVPVQAQPPDASASAALYVPEIEQQWKALRNEVGATEFTDAPAAIARYQKFYETEGARSAITAIQISNTIAQLYWQVSHNQQKALEIYDWALKNYGYLPQSSLLKTQRELVAQTGDFKNSDVDVEAVTLKPAPAADNASPSKVLLGAAQTPAQPDGVSLLPVSPNFAPEPVILNPLADKPATANPDTVKVLSSPPTTSAPDAVTFNPPADKPATINLDTVKVLSPPSTTTTPDAVILNPPSEKPVTTNPDTVKVLSSPSTSAPDTVVLNSPADKAATSNPDTVKVLSPLPVVTPDTVVLPTASQTQMQLATSGVDARKLTLAGYVGLWRSGKVTIEELFQQASLSAKDALDILSTPGILTNWGVDKPLRDALMDWLQQHSPQSLTDPEKLAPPVRFTLAEYYAKQRDPRAETLYKNLLAGDFPLGVWWYKIIVMNSLAEYYGSIGQFDKAAQMKLQIGQETTDEVWTGNIKVEAARFYRKAGETEKAQALYEQAEKSPYAWSAGMAMWDQAYQYMQKKQFDEARKVLSQPLTGKYADQIKVLLLSAMAVSYYRQDNFEQASKYGNETLAQYKSLKNPLQHEGLKGQLNVVTAMLEMIGRWEKLDPPVFVNPTEMSTFVNKGNKPIVWQLVVPSLHPITATVTSNSPDVTLRPITNGPVDTSLFGFANIVEMTIAADNVNAILTVKSPQYPNWVVHVPIIMELRKTKEEQQTIDTITVN